MTIDIETVTAEVQQEAAFLGRIMAALETVIVGQRFLVERILVALLTNGHVLIEGVPGLAKTKVVKGLTKLVDARFQRITRFQRIQFTPDLLPADLIGTLIYNPRDGLFTTRKGPIFANVVLADEINRAPAKVHSALLEAMEERQVTVGDSSYPLDDLFLVLATQNPIEQEGTYLLPEAQMDRFMLKIVITYPSRDEEREIMRRAGRTGKPAELAPLIHPDDIIRMRALVDAIYLDPKIEKYIIDLVFATRQPADYGFAELARFITYGASVHRRGQASTWSSPPAPWPFCAVAAMSSPRMSRTSRLKSCATGSSRYEADAEGITVDWLINRLLAETEVP